MEKKNIIMSDKVFLGQLAEALGLQNNHVRRVIIDLKVLQPAKVYVEMFGDERLLDVRWVDLTEAEIIMADAKNEDSADLSGS